MNPKMRFPCLVFCALMLAAPNSGLAQEAPTSALDTIVVTASRTEEKMREVAANVTVITAEQINSSTASTMDQLMAQQGFYILNQGSQKLLQIRGMGQPSMGNELESPVLVLVNGRRVGGNNLALMGLANVERVEIIRGPSAVQYGSSGMGGVVNIVTRRGKEGEFQATAEAGIGSFNLHKESLGFSGGTHGFDFSGGILNFARNAYDVENGKTWEHTDIDSSTALHLDMGYTFLETHRLGVDFNYYHQNDMESASSGFSDTSAIHNDTEYNSYDYNNYSTAFVYDGAMMDDQFSWLVRYAFGRDRSEGSSRNALYPWSQNNVVDTQSFTAQATYDGAIVSVTLGLDYLKYDLDSTGTVATSEDMAGYVSAKLRLFDDKLIFSAGGRYDDYDLDGNDDDASDDNFSPSVGLAYLPVQWLKFRTNYSEGFRMPSPKQYLGEAPWYVGALDLDPEKSKTFEVGVDMEWSAVTASLTYFHTDWEDKIYANPIATGSWTYRYENLDKSVIDGVEFSLNADIGQFFDWGFELRPYVTLTHLMTTENKDDGSVAEIGDDRLTNIPRNIISYGLHFNYPDYDLMANLNASYNSNIFTMDRRTTSSTYYEYINACSGTVVDLTIEKGLFRFDDENHLKLRVEVNNLFDEDNERYLDYPGPGRNFYVGLKYEYR
ncbi:TonB-dependent receptor [Desulfosarcina sp. OttesenSCG-928-A07]|nr:TonB-dependent receptor [Desulfosarcina sp. OttesenSCG-928-G17]MDL2330263.1 TonB-dependent receptor [Desulfosarcina sp. OttesenSCG-928-A07]